MQCPHEYSNLETPMFGSFFLLKSLVTFIFWVGSSFAFSFTGLLIYLMAYLELYHPLLLVLKITCFWKLPIYLTFLVYFFQGFFEIVLKILKISSISVVICFACDFLLFFFFPLEWIT